MNAEFDPPPGEEHQRQMAPGPCPGCKYDLRGTSRRTAGMWICPECGRKWLDVDFEKPPRRIPAIVPRCARYVAINVAVTNLVLFNSGGNWLATVVAWVVTCFIQGLLVFVRSVKEDPGTAPLKTTAVMACVVIVSGVVELGVSEMLLELLRSRDC